MTTTHYHVTFTSDAEPPTDADITNLVGRMLSFTRWPQRDVAVRVLEPDEANATEQLALAMRRIDLLTGDLELIGNALKDEAVRREWCSEYEAFVDKVNACTKVFDLPSRPRDWEVRHHYVVTIVGQVSALDEDQATSLAAAQFREIREALIFNLSAQDQPETGSLVDVDWSYDGARVSLEED